jgi:hypothetical protein
VTSLVPLSSFQGAPFLRPVVSPRRRDRVCSRPGSPRQAKAERGFAGFVTPEGLLRATAGVAGLAPRRRTRVRIASPRLELGMAPRGDLSRFAASAFPPPPRGSVTWTGPSRKGRAPARPAFGNPSPGAAPDFGEAPKRPAASGVMDATRIFPGCKSPRMGVGVDPENVAEGGVSRRSSDRRRSGREVGAETASEMPSRARDLRETMICAVP